MALCVTTAVGRVGIARFLWWVVFRMDGHLRDSGERGPLRSSAHAPQKNEGAEGEAVIERVVKRRWGGTVVCLRVVKGGSLGEEQRGKYVSVAPARAVGGSLLNRGSQYQHELRDGSVHVRQSTVLPAPSPESATGTSISPTELTVPAATAVKRAPILSLSQPPMGAPRRPESPAAERSPPAVAYGCGKSTGCG